MSVGLTNTSAAATAAGDELAVGIDSDGVLALELVLLSDLRAFRDETWWRGVGTGALSPKLSAHTWRVLPGESTARGRLKGFSIELRSGRTFYREHFPTATLAPVARRAALRLFERQILGADDQYNFFLAQRPAESGERLDDKPLRINVATEPLQFESTDLAALRAGSALWIGPVDGRGPSSADESPTESMDIFCPQAVWEAGREMARFGGEEESGGVFVGHLLRDTDSPAVAVMFDDCLQAEHAREEKFAVEFTGETWAEIRQRLQQRRVRMNLPGEMIVASVHGHNFAPEADANGCKTCELCHQLEVCSRSTAHASQDDFRWHSIVFAGQSWATLLVWGWNARDEEEWRMYGLRNGTLQQRSVRILP